MPARMSGVPNHELARQRRGGHGIIGTGGFGVTGMGTVMGGWGIAKADTAWAAYFSGPVMVEGTLDVEDNVTVARDVSVCR